MVGRVVLLALTAAAHGALATAAAPLRDALRAPTERARQVAPALGVHVVDLVSGKTVYSFEADRQRIVASNTKLFTTAAALDLLSPGYYFETRIRTRGRLESGVLRGDLAVVGAGDPNISGRHYDGDSLAIFREWGRRLAARGIRRVEGDLFLAHGIFQPPSVHPDWPENQLDAWYEAPVEALSFNDNCVLVKVKPGKEPGRPAVVELVPPLPVVDVRNGATTTASARRHRVAIRRPNGSREIVVTGAVFHGAESVDAWITVPDPLAYFAAALEKAFDEAEVELAGSVRRVEELPGDDWSTAFSHRSDLLTTLEIINKRSQNFFSESVVKVLGAELCDEGSWRGGLKVVRDFLSHIGIPPGSYSLADGSGMSRNNRFTPRQITTLLAYMFRHPRGKEYLLTLPYSGEEELRWEKRLAEPPYRGNVFAKTGGLNGVSTLSGYAKARSGKLYAFSILCNRTVANWRAKEAQDRIVRALVEHG